MAKDKTQAVDPNASKVDPNKSYSAITGPAVGASMKRSDVHLEDLGYLDELPDVEDLEGEGTGDKCVVIIDYLCGANGNGFVRGDVRRLSKFINGYENPKVSRDVIKAAAKRLFVIGAIRKATAEEMGEAWVEITEATETDAFQQERAKRVAAEQRLAELEEQFGVNKAESAGTENSQFEG